MLLDLEQIILPLSERDGCTHCGAHLGSTPGLICFDCELENLMALIPATEPAHDPSLDRIQRSCGFLLR